MWRDEELSWKNHAQSLSSTLSKIAGVMYKIRNYVNFHRLKTSYYSLTQSKLIYSMLAWVTANKQNLKQLNIAQNKILRIIKFSPRKTRMTNLYRNYEIVQLEKLNKIESINLFIGVAKTCYMNSLYLCIIM